MIDEKELIYEKFVEQKKRTIIARKEKNIIYDDFIISLENQYELLEKIEEMSKEQKAKAEEIKTLKRQLEMEQKKYKKLDGRYKALSKSKLGKITLKYWDVKRGHK